MFIYWCRPLPVNLRVCEISLFDCNYDVIFFLLWDKEYDDIFDIYGKGLNIYFIDNYCITHISFYTL